MNERCLLAERYLVLMPKCSEAMKCYVSNSMTVRDLCLIISLMVNCTYHSSILESVDTQ